MPTLGNPSMNHRKLLALVAADLEPVAAAVAHDVREPVEVVRPAVALIVRALLDADELTEGSRAALRVDGERAARAGVTLPALLDRYLSTGWVLLDAASALVARADDLAATPDAIPRLGAVLLRAGDAAAAALSEGYGRVERETAARLAAARGELLDEFLALAPGDATSLGRLLRRAASLGLEPSGRREVVVATLLEGVAENEQQRVLDEATRLIVPPPRAGRAGAPAESPLVGVRHGTIVIVASGTSQIGTRVGRALHAAAGSGWVAVSSDAPEGLLSVGAAYLDASDGLAAARAAGRRNEVVDARDLLLERALMTRGDLTRAAVDRELGPLLDAGRGGAALIPTLEAFLGEGQNVRRTARRLGIAPRTVSYRLQRAERLLGRPLEGDAWLRLAAVLFAAGLGRDGAKGDRRH